METHCVARLPHLLMSLRPAPLSVRTDSRTYPIRFVALATVPTELRRLNLNGPDVIIVTDENVAAHYRSPLLHAFESDGWTPHLMVVPPGESSKSLGQLKQMYDTLLPQGIERSTPVCTVGGGVVGDLGGFAAATLLRGVPLVHVPTSLLAQVDSSIGGKTGINHDVGKNLIGSFYQPHAVLVDPETLLTLPAKEWINGMAEAVKHALIADVELIDYLEAHLVDILGHHNLEATVPAIRNAMQVKVDIVAQDEREAGQRAWLNFGHTFAHAIEHVAGYGAIAHGQAVAIGMRAALYLSHQRFPDAIDRDRLDALITRLPRPDVSHLRFDLLHQAMQHDKKTQDGTLRFVLLRAPGDPFVADDCTPGALRHAWQFACSS